MITLSEMQTIELRLLLELKKICDRHKLRYFIDGGTLLGAYCYGGFIPWDDDIDIKMPRPDYENLVKYRDELPEHMQLVFPEEDQFTYTFTKLEDKRTTLIESPKSEKEHRGSVYIDILPMDGYIPKWIPQLKRYNTLFHISKSGFPNSLKGIIYSYIYNPKNVYIRMTKLAKRCQYDTSEFVGLVIEGDTEKEKYRRASFDNPVLLPFEGYYFPASNEYEDHLVKFYGKHVLDCKGNRNLPKYSSGHTNEAYWNL